MKRLHLLVIKNFVGPFLFMFLLSVFIFLMIGVWRYTENLTGKGLSISIIAEFFGYIAITTIPMALPVSILLASIMTFGNLGEHYELTAIKSSGIPISKLMRPLIIITFLLSLCAFYFSNNILPVTTKKAKTLMYDIQRQNPTFSLQEGIFNRNIPGWNIKVDKIDNVTKIMYGIIIYQLKTNTKEASVIVAERGIMYSTGNIRFLNITLYNGAFYSESTTRNSYPFRRGEFEEYSFSIELPSFDLVRSDGEKFKGEYKLLNVYQLIYVRDSLKNIYDQWKNNYAIDLRNRSYLKNESYKLKTDSSYLKRITDKHININNILNRLNLRDKRIVVSSALIDAENVLNSSKEKIDFNARLDRWLRMYDIYWHKKFTLSLACIVFFFVGAPLGAIIRKGGIGMPVIVSIILFIIYYILSKSTENMASEGQIGIIFGSWFPFAFYLPLGIFLTYKATTDSTLLNSDAYWKLIKKIVKFKNKWV